jgi:transcriptional regulator with XRE-family HTH domain
MAMAVEWQLKKVLLTQEIYNAPQLTKALEEKLGIRISRVALEKLLKKQPASLRMETAQILCTVLQLPLEAFLKVTPEPLIRYPGEIIQPYKKQAQPEAPLIVDPRNFF